MATVKEHWISPLARAERMLTNHMLELEQELTAGANPRHPAWVEYVATVDVLVRVMERLRPWSQEHERTMAERFTETPPRHKPRRD